MQNDLNDTTRNTIENVAKKLASYDGEKWKDLGKREQGKYRKRAVFIVNLVTTGSATGN